jgi:hypothetical protein
MGSEAILAPIGTTPAKTTESAAAVATAAAHHFTAYGRANPRDIAAFVAAKVLLERAIAAEAGAGKPAFKVGLRHYTVRLIAGCRTAEGEVETELETTSPLLGWMSIPQPRPGEAGELTRTKRSQTSIVLEVRPAQPPSGGASTASNSMSSRTRGAFDFAVVNGNVTHCVWTPTSGSENVSG